MSHICRFMMYKLNLLIWILVKRPLNPQTPSNTVVVSTLADCRDVGEKWAIQPKGSMELVYLPIHEWLIFTVNVGKYTSPMDPMEKGTCNSIFYTCSDGRSTCSFWVFTAEDLSKTTPWIIGVTSLFVLSSLPLPPLTGAPAMLRCFFKGLQS